VTTILKASYRHLLDADSSPEEAFIAYHERTKHYFHRYAASLGAMDWATQPDPFRRYPGADLVRLLLPKPGRLLPYWQLYAFEDVPSEPLSLLENLQRVSGDFQELPRIRSDFRRIGITPKKLTSPKIDNMGLAPFWRTKLA
jgi:hypothetical protein